MNTGIDGRLDRIDRTLRLYKVCLLAVSLLAAIGFCLAFIGFRSHDGDGVLRTRALVIEDAEGRPRIVMGAPLTALDGRSRKDALIGIAYLDENGADRVILGAQPDPMTAEGVKPRRTGAAGILIHGKDGVERGGYSVLDDGTALLTLDWPGTGEAAVMSSGEAFSGIGLFYRSELGIYREALTLGVEREGNHAFAKFTDPTGHQRLRLHGADGGAPVLKRYDADGVESPTP